VVKLLYIGGLATSWKREVFQVAVAVASGS